MLNDCRFLIIIFFKFVTSFILTLKEPSGRWYLVFYFILLTRGHEILQVVLPC